MALEKIVPRTVLVACLLATVACSGKDAKNGRDGQNVDRKGLTNQKLVDSFDGDRKYVAADVYFLGVCYFDHCENMNKPPANYKELEKLARDTDAPERVKKNVRENIDFVWNVKPTEKPGVKRVIAYERNADKDGNRVVMTTIGLYFMDDAEFQAALKAGKE